ncbi:sugar porter family MFS transporter [Paraglaciecola sp. MB-3u-78]|jgi:sugar porter (SP) family MFS transporter|uniref:sugar porter family MFS transporter n=1 Tax=Paraglaciecola sp. MB-3u-78 TaxID=2058332 RepID=UPI000C34C6DD|nr:sugar porter family MFS transporter [Paraglaciecola sp. MB-3u-78]PKG92945.1 MFS transporter [Paraglaciecola sp. MB-3u-78]
MKYNPVVLYTIIVSLGGFIFGFDASVISGTIGQISAEFGLSTVQQGFVVAAPTLGGIAATITAGYISDTIGRRQTLIGIALLYLVSAIFSALAPTYDTLIVARFIGGLAFCSLMIAPIYIAEICPAESRGKMVSINQLNIVVGISAAYFSNYMILQMSQSNTDLVMQLGIADNTWRWMLGMEIIPAFIWLVALFFVPKSPRWLLVQQKQREAQASLKRLYPKATQDALLATMTEIKATTGDKVLPVVTRLKEIVGPKMRLALVIGLVVGISQQATGVNAIYFYAPSIFEQSGVGTNAAFAQAIWVGITNIIFTILAMALIDKLGRKPLLVVGLIGVAISMTICTIGYSMATYQLTSADLVVLSELLKHDLLNPLIDQVFTSDVEFKRAVIGIIGEQAFQTNQGAVIQAAATLNATLIKVGILGFVASFACSLGPVMWVLFSEIFPNHLRGLAISVVGIANSLVSFLVQLAFPWELANLGAALTFAIYGIFAVIGLLFVIKIVPETKGKSLEELEVILGGKAT